MTTDKLLELLKETKEDCLVRKECYYTILSLLEELEKANKQSPLTKEEVSDFNERFGYFEYGDAQGGKSRAFVKAIEEKHGIHQSP